ncbi:MAG: helix-turn-helix transcriptional regulator [Ktedonobacteraceae bacterium]|nr:helix-turn-helix transcriptional regulator [Ktedonobacteraceae bacterium]
MGKEKQVNQKLKHEREARCWTLQEVADRLYELCLQEDPNCAIIAGDTVGRWERGFNTPSAHYQRKLCILFGKDALELGFISKSPYI